MSVSLSWVLQVWSPVGPLATDQGASLGRDIRFDDDFVVAANGDYATVVDIDALWQWIRICLATKPGEYKHDPDFGVGIGTFVKKPDTATNRAELRHRIISNLSRDDRIQEVVDVSFQRYATFQGDTTVAGVDVIRVNISVVVNRKLQRLRPFDFSERV